MEDLFQVTFEREKDEKALDILMGEFNNDLEKIKPPEAVVQRIRQF